MPKTRPTDNMATGFGYPQEDEFALCNMGIPSPYLDMIFPNRQNLYNDYYDLLSLSEVQRENWRKEYLRFLKSLSFRREEEASPALVTAIDLLQKMNEDGKRKLPEDAPLGFVPKKLRPLVESAGEVNKGACRVHISCVAHY